jgi:dolichyl-diphosphooligosaccharide--protein glycosyltransferase
MHSQNIQNTEVTKYSRFWPVIYLIAFLLNMRIVSSVLTDFGVFPRGTDSYYHMRRIIYFLEHSFQLPSLDYYANFPIGSPIYYPYGFTLSYATFVKIISLGTADEWWATALCCLLTPLIAASIPCIAYFIGVAYGEARIGLWASIILALFPCEYYFVGYIDHHVFETFWLSFYMLFYLKANKFLETDPAKAKRNAIASGLSISAGLLFTNSLPALIPLHCGILFLQLLKVWQDKKLRFTILSLNVFLFIALLTFLAPFVSTKIATPINPNLGLGWLVSFIIYLFVLGVLWVWQRDSKDLTPLPTKLIFLSLVIFTVSCLGLEWGSLTKFLAFSSTGFFFKADPVVAMISESRPLWLSSIWVILGTYSGGLLLWPLAVVLMLTITWKQSNSNWIIAICSLATSILAFIQLRFMTLFIVPFALTIGFFLQYIFQKLNLENVQQINKSKLVVNQLIFAGIVLFILYPLLSLINLRSGIVGFNDERFVSIYPTLTWIEQNTPKTSVEGNKDTDYSIVCPWDLGNWVIFFSKRPAVATPLVHVAREGLQEGSEIFMLPPEKALDLIQKRRTKYILIAPMPIKDNFNIAQWPNKNPDILDDQDEALKRSLYYNLLQGGVPNGNKALQHFRLVYQSSPEFIYKDRPYTLLFEYVPGVKVSGKAKPNSNIKVFGIVKDKLNQTTLYNDVTQTDSEGNFSLVLPYAMGIQKYSAYKLIKPYKLQSDEKTIEVSASETDVLTGKSQEVNFN